MKAAFNFLKIILVLILVLIAIFIIYLFTTSSGVIKAFYNEEGEVLENSVAEKTKVNINGYDQGMFIRGRDKDNPVILFVHGGPGVPEYFLNETHETDIHDYFTVCWWEARGAGMSYSSDLNAEDLTMALMVEDTIAVTEYLADRFDKDKIYIMGHSFGTIPSVLAVDQRPDLYEGIISMSQATGQELLGVHSNTITYKYLMEVFTERNDTKSIKELDKYSNVNPDGSVSFKEEYLGQIDNLKHKAGAGTMRNMESAAKGIFLPNITSKCYTLGEKINYWKGKAFMRETPLYQEATSMNLQGKVDSLEVPIYFLAGRYDYTSPYPIQKEFYESLTNTAKGFYTFEESAHSPLWEEPDKFVEILRKDVLEKDFSLSD